MHENDIPKEIETIRINDAFFDIHSDIKDTPLIREILRNIDKAEYVSNKTFCGRDKDLGNLSASYLSTGVKTLINIKEHPDKCIDIMV
ncbi:MAG: DUF4869 domain-containing protein [Lachnospiraceae bacterium]|nr:DUF4869 domain-containing protein [Lachnospiraceae bacterium]